MKIIIRHEAAVTGDSSSPDQVCVWVADDDGKYIGKPTFLAPDESVDVDVGADLETTLTPKAAVGEVETIS